MKRIHLWLISLLSGLLLWAAWPTGGFTPVIFFALVPLLWVEDYVLTQQRKKDALKDAKPGEMPQTAASGGKPVPRYHIFLYAFSAFTVWNTLTTWWVWNSTPAAVFAFTANAALMAGAFSLFHYTSRHFFKKGGRWSILFIYWLAFEYFHHHWDLSWPWLTLGNAFSVTPAWVQWYEITGPLGGSLWILACNVALLYVVKDFRTPFLRKRTLTAVCLMLVPFIGSLVRYYTYREKGKPVEVVVVQPNIDPYNEQFELRPTVSTGRMLNLTSQQISPQTRYVVTPESMIQEYVWEENLPYCSRSLAYVYDFLKDYPKAELIAGISSLTRVKPQDSNQSGVRRFKYATDPESRFFRSHNTVIKVGNDPHRPIPVHHKSRLTPGVEILPFAGRLKFIERLAINMGGTTGTLGVEEGPNVFAAEDGLDFSSVICYESVFADYVAGDVRAGAKLLFVSTNDGWWGNTPGHRQHASYARLRAVETRRDIARSANTGISCFIDQAGNVYQKTRYWEPACIKQTLYANSRLTFYVKYGEILGKCSLMLSLFFLLLTFIYRIFPDAWRDFRRQKAEM